MSRPDERLEPPAGAGPGWWLGQLARIGRQILVFSFAAMGVALFFRFGARALLILVPVAVLLFGTTIFAWAMLKVRGKR